ncbi:MAG: TraR/DksA C4-type zinc finger protein [Thermomicrobiales bacterium]|nr:TraR/DksA C4-type zinc finger protein [Thermomicrobiales bacterium]
MSQQTVLDRETIEALRTDLVKRRVTIIREVVGMAGEIQSLGEEQGDEGGSLGNHFADDGSSMSEAERLSTISADLDGLLTQIDAALERMDEGTYGICQRCGKPIAKERLEAFPYVAHCIDCQAKLERQQSLRAGF